MSITVNAPEPPLCTQRMALDLVARGLAVFPLPPGARRPARARDHLRCLTDADLVLRHWPEGANVGVGCRASRLFALDLDVDGDGVGTLAALADRLGQPWPATFTVHTPSGGLHLYFRVSADCTLGSTSGGVSGLGPGVDTRGPGRRIGGYLIGPGSRVSSGDYRVETDTPVAALPEWVKAHLKEHKSRTGKGS